MSFACYLQYNTSDDKRLDKVLTPVATLTGVLKAETSIMTPVIMFDYPLSYFATSNYMTIPDFNRSYFITDVRSITAVMTEVSLKVDVLSTYATEIRNCNAIVGKQESRWNLYLDDGTFKTYSNPKVLTRAFPSGFGNNFYFVLAVAGEA